jgi:hypothetical protein
MTDFNKRDYQSFICSQDETAHGEENEIGRKQRTGVSKRKLTGREMFGAFDEYVESLRPHAKRPIAEAKTREREVAQPTLDRAWVTDEREYGEHSSSYWPMPNEFVTEGHLARLWTVAGIDERRSGKAAISALPVIGAYMNTSGRFLAGHAKMSRLTGISVRSVSDVGHVLTATGLGSHRVVQRANRKFVSEWTLDSVAFVAAKRGEHVISNYNSETSAGGYFDFQSALVYGGNWQAMSAVQRLLYLAVGSHVRMFENTQSAERLLSSNGVDRHTMEAILCHEGRLLFAFLSYAQLEHLTGASRSALARAAAACPPLGATAKNRAVPISVVSTVSGAANLYVLFDDFAPICGTVSRRQLRPRTAERGEPAVDLKGGF